MPAPKNTNITQEERIKVSRIALEELRRVFDHVSNIYDQLRVKALALLAGEVAIVTFLFSGENKIQMPDVISLRIFLFVGIISLIAAFILLLRSLATSDWNIPGDMDEIEKLAKNPVNRITFLQTMHTDYLDGTRECIKIVNKKGIMVNWSLYLLLIGAIILLVIKYGGSK